MTDRPWLQARKRHADADGQPTVPDTTAAAARAPLPSTVSRSRRDEQEPSQPAGETTRGPRRSERLARSRDASADTDTHTADKTGTNGAESTSTAASSQTTNLTTDAGPAETTEPAPGATVASGSTARAGKQRILERTLSSTNQRRSRKARLRLTKVDPWSVMKVAFLLSVAFGIVTVVSVYLVWTAIESSSTFSDINNTVHKAIGEQAANFRVQDHVNTNQVMSITTMIAGLDVIIFTALATLGAFLYNLAAALLGGVELTLASDD